MTRKTEEKRPFTVDDHKALNERNTARKLTAVNDALKFPTGDRFEKDLAELLDSDAEANGENIVISLMDLDRFDHINRDFGENEGDRVLIEAGRHIRNGLPAEVKVYRIGGDEFAAIFKGEMEREEVFLLLNELKNSFDVKSPDGIKLTMTIGMATAFVDANRVPELVRKADSALYRAKVGGRNKVAMAREEKMIPKTSHYTQDQLQRLSKLSKREGTGEAILLREALDMLLKKYDI